MLSVLCSIWLTWILVSIYLQMDYKICRIESKVKVWSWSYRSTQFRVFGLYWRDLILWTVRFVQLLLRATLEIMVQYKMHHVTKQNKVMHNSLAWTTSFRPNGWNAVSIGDCSQTLVGGPDAKRGPFKFLSLLKGVLKKLLQIFQGQLSLRAFLRGWPIIFMAKRGALKLFWCRKGEPKKFFCYELFLHQAPLTSVCEQSLRQICHLQCNF